MNGSTQSPGSTRSPGHSYWELAWRWVPPLIWMGLIFFVSAQSTVPSVPGRWDLMLKKGMHMIAYAILTWLYLRAMRGHHRQSNGLGDAWIRVLGAGLALLYALSDEYHQTFVPGRDGNLVDVAVDAVGVSLAMLLDWRLRPERCLVEGETSE